MEKGVHLGLRRNWKQFAILVLVNAFVGGMVGMERTIFPEFANTKFGISSYSAILTFIIAFGIAKAVANYFTGRWANAVGRKNLLIIGWIIALPIPFILMYSPVWGGIVFANVLLGISQGLTWSSTVVMKIDLVGPKDRGMAMGFNEFAGYLAVGLIAYWSGIIAARYGVEMYPFYLGVGLSILGLLTSIFLVQDTRKFVQTESARSTATTQENVFIETSFKNKTLSAITQAGMVNNLNDGMIWGLLPILLATLGFVTRDIAIVAGVYPLVWGIGQLFTGKMADHFSKKRMLVIGMLLQGVAILGISQLTDLNGLIAMAVVVGLGTALVYPTFLAAISDHSHPQQRAESIGVFRLWRDMGYAIGALLSGIIADFFGVAIAIAVIGFITLMSAMVIKIRYGRM